MNVSFYNSAAGASAQQTKLDIIANNIANINTVGYKTQSAGFVDLLYSNMNAKETENTNLKVGSGVRCEKTDMLFSQGSYQSTGQTLDFAIKGKGFFAVSNPATGQVKYTRDGSFRLSSQGDEEFYLVTAKGDLVLDKNEEPITLPKDGTGIDANTIGVFDFQNTEGFKCEGDTLFADVPKNGEKQLMENADVASGYLEYSNVDLANEMSKLIEAQRAYQMTLKMIQTSDEVESTVNNLR